VRRAITGLRAWLVQRASAVYMLFFLIFMLGHFLFAPFSSYLSWRNWVLSPAVSVAFSIFFAALLSHVWVGIGLCSPDCCPCCRARIAGPCVISSRTVGDSNSLVGPGLNPPRIERNFQEKLR
jgi:succinate dehydrogenase hydrophobic membrane anchor protein